MSTVDDLLPAMRRVQAAERDLHDLALLWQMIEAASSISCPQEVEGILPTLVQTRLRFEELQARLVRQLGTETLAALGDELTAAAQCTIDILVRNLFERTADVGFLATDDVLCQFCAAAPAARELEHAAFVQRLAEYRAKYTVYDDVAVLAPSGQVLGRLDTQRPLAVSADPIVQMAAAGLGYVERFAPSDLAADGAPTLLYAHRIDNAAGHCIGVLVLRFRIADELQRIFSSVGTAQRRLALVLLDDAGRVIASNDATQVPLGVTLQTQPAGQVALALFGGHEVLTATCASRGYQGYAGPGWRAQAMVPVQTAFRGRAQAGATAGPAPATRVALDNEELRQIQAEVDAINRNLRRVVWNGHLVAGTRGMSGQHDRPGSGGRLAEEEAGQARLKAVLEQVNGASARTRDRVAAAINELEFTTLDRTGHQAQDVARLAADILDRNLYERANDCRWWALSPVLCRVLAQPADADGGTALNAVLEHINSLYTVYARLVVFDLGGAVRGASQGAGLAPLAAVTVDAELLAAVLALGDSQQYAVSAFGPSPLSDGVPTSIYLAAVRNGGRTVGGIAIVFNAQRELQAILDDVLGSRSGVAVFVDRDNRVVSSSSAAAFAVGQPLPFGAGQRLAEHAGAQFAVACVAAIGYREFKTRDGDRNHVRAVVALRLGTVGAGRPELSDKPLRPLPAAARGGLLEFALFQAGAGRFALQAAVVLEARPVQGLLRTPGGRPHALGLLDVSGPQSSNVIPVFCGRGLLGHGGAPAGDGVVLVLCAVAGGKRPVLGLRVDDVLNVVSVAPEHLQKAPAGLRSHAPLLAGLLRMRAEATDGDVLVQVVDGQALLALPLCGHGSVDTPLLAAAG